MNAPEHSTVPRPALAGDARSASSQPKLGRIAIVALVLVVIAAIAGILPRLHQRAALKVETADLSIPTVIVVNPVPGSAGPGLELPAEVRALTEAPIYARASGYLKKWFTDLGARVKEGDLLAEIDTPELDQELAHAQAELTQADAARALAEVTSKRWSELLKTSSVSDQETAEKTADLALKSATVEAARATVNRLQDLKRFSRVTAPFAGIITARRTDVGDLIAAGGNRELFRLADISRLRVYVRVPQNATRSVAAGQSAEVTVPELAGRTFKAQVVRLSGAMDPQSRTLLTELEVDNSDGQLFAGGYAQVRFTEARVEAALTLPSNALLFRAEGPQAGVVSSDGIVELRNLTIGRDFGATMEVVNGVGAADRVILNPPDSLVGGMKVRIAPSGPSAK